MQPNKETTTGGNTRERLLEAGVRLFGLHGFEATATRTLAAEAGVNLGAIRYHFGGKDGLYRAVLEYVVAVKNTEIAPLFEEVAAVCADPGTDRDALRACLRNLVRGVVTVMLGNPSSLQFSQIMMQEQIAPTGAFGILYKGFLQKMLGAWSTLLARLTGLPMDSPELELRTLAVIGQFTIFRMGMPFILKRLGAERLATEHLEAIAAMGIQHIEAIVDGFAPVCPEAIL